MYYNMEPPIIPVNNELNTIFKMNNGKKVSIYLNNNQILNGIIEKANNDYIIISDPSTGKWIFVFNQNIAYILFDDGINYQIEFISN